MPQLAVFPKAYIDDLCVHGTMSLRQWIEKAATLDVDGLEFYTGIIDLNASADWSALTPETIATAKGCDGQPRVWRLIENLTSFERNARQRAPDMAVVWLPGFPPGWWQENMRHLLAAVPAPAEIACDPDPAGIAIALQAAKLWEEAHLPWLPFAMRRDDLLTARQRKPLGLADGVPATWSLSKRS